MTIRVKNKSDKAVLLATIQLQFPRRPGSEGLLAVDEIFFGNYELLRRPPTAAERSSGLAHGDTTDIQLSADELEGIKVLLAGNGYGPFPEKLDLRIGSVVFDDGILWQGGTHFRLAETSPQHWATIEPFSSSKTAPSGPSISKTPSFSWADRIFGSAGQDRKEPTFLKTTYGPTTYAFPQSGCHPKGPSNFNDCGIPGWACQYEQQILLDGFGGYYIASCSWLCKTMSGGNCNWKYHASQIANLCSGGGGPGGGGEGGGAGGGYDGNGSCYTDWDCDFGYHCGDGFMCVEDSFIN